MLANIFLHHVVDSFVHQWRKSKAKGEVYIVRYADDLVIACERQDDAEELLEALDGRLKRYGLSLNREKTRLIRFGRRWNGSGGAGSQTFDFLGFTHIAGKDRQGRFLVQRKTSCKRLNRSLNEIGQWCRQHLHAPMWWQCQQLNIKLRGHYQYYGLRGNFESLKRFRHGVWKHWCRALRRRSQKVNKHRLYVLLKTRFVLLVPRITHSEGWFALNPGHLLGRAGWGNAPRPVL